MIRAMEPCLDPRLWVFCTTRDETLAQRARPLATLREDEGLSLILDIDEARALGFDTSHPMCCITLRVFSALDGVGLTAAVAAALADKGIPCNMVAGYHHDHALVPAQSAAEALLRLQALQETGE